MTDLNALVVRLSSEIMHIVDCSLKQEELFNEGKRIVAEHVYVNCLANYLVSNISLKIDSNDRQLNVWLSNLPEEVIVKFLKQKIYDIVEGMRQGIMNHLKERKSHDYFSE